MADKKHCDICDKVIGGNERTGMLVYGSFYADDKRTKLELCENHNNQFRRAIDELIKGAQGYVVNEDYFRINI